MSCRRGTLPNEWVHFHHWYVLLPHHRYFLQHGWCLCYTEILPHSLQPTEFVPATGNALLIYMCQSRELPFRLHRLSRINFIYRKKLSERVDKKKEKKGEKGYVNLCQRCLAKWRARQHCLLLEIKYDSHIVDKKTIISDKKPKMALATDFQNLYEEVTL